MLRALARRTQLDSRRLFTIHTMAADSSAATGFLKFVNESPSPYHATQASVAILEAAGFQRISETVSSAGVDDFAHLKPQGKYFFTRNQSTVVAFAVGGRFQPGNGIHMVHR